MTKPRLIKGLMRDLMQDVMPAFAMSMTCIVAVVAAGIAGKSSACAAPLAQTAPTAPAESKPPHSHAQPPAAQEHHGQAHGVLSLPPIEFRPDIIDLGIIAPGKRATGTVYVQNISDRWLEIQSVKPDCSCTGAAVSNNSIAPGQAVTLQVEYHANTAMGEWKGRVRMLFKGYDVIDIPAKAMVALAVRADPPYIIAVPDTQTQVRMLSGEYDVFSIDEKPFRILAVSGEQPQYVGFNPEFDEPRNYYRLKWDFNNFNPRTCRDQTGKRIPGWVTIETDHPDCPILDLEVRHECNMRPLPKRTDTWYIQEKRVLVGLLTPDQPTEFEVVAKWIPNSPHDEIKTVVSEMTQQFTAEFVGSAPVEDGIACKVRITPAESHKGLVYGVIRLHSNSQNAPITVIGVVR